MRCISNYISISCAAKLMFITVLDDQLRLQLLLPSISVWLKVVFVDGFLMTEVLHEFDMLDHLDL